MFESKEQLAREIQDLLETLRNISSGDEVCLLEPQGLLFQTGSGGSLAAFLRGRSEALFAIPEGVAQGGLEDDLFASWEGPSVLLAFVNRRVALALSCPDAQEAEGRITELLQVLVDRLLRFEPRYRLDPQGRGLFVGRPRLDMIVVGPPMEEARG